MSEVRVFELAKELKMPAKQLLSRMRKAGIPVTGNFSEMSFEQAEIVRKMAKSAIGIVVPESVKRTTIRQKKPSENTAAETDLPEKSKKVKASKIVTISTKSKADVQPESTESETELRKEEVSEDSEEIIENKDDHQKEEVAEQIEVNADFENNSENEAVADTNKSETKEKPELEAEVESDAS